MVKLYLSMLLLFIAVLAVLS